MASRRARRALEAVLPPTAEVGARGDALLVNHQPLHATWIGEGWLADAKRFLREDGGATDIAVAKVMSPGARRVLSEGSVGWVDETGAAEIAVGSLVVSKTGRPVEQDQRTTDWTPAVLAIAEALLCGTKATVASTQEATGLSTGSCTNGLRFLTEQELLVADAPRGRYSARRIADFDRLLEAYASAVAAADPGPQIQVGVTWRDLATGLSVVGEGWNANQLDWACTGALAASVLAPYMTNVGTAVVYVSAETPAELEAAATVVGLEAMEGGRLRLSPFPTVAVPRLSTVRDGLRVAPWPRVYADLRPTGVRGEEAAEHLKEVMRAG